MNPTTTATRRAARAQIHGMPDDPGAIVSLSSGESAEPVARVLLLPEEEQLSLPPLDDGMPGPIAPLTRYLGPHLTVASPAWVGDSVSKMRALQKMLVERSLLLDQADRTECMDAIVIVESAVQMRLRFQQMRTNDLPAIKTTEVKTP